MCKGIFDSNDQCQLSIDMVVGIGQIASLSARTLHFIVDTGATSTIISAADAVRLGFSYDNKGRPLRNSVRLLYEGSAAGVGGRLKLYRLESVFLTLVSHDPNNSERHTEYVKRVYVAGEKYQDESLMGMDLLRRFKITVDPETLEVNLSRIPVSGTSYLVQHS